MCVIMLGPNYITQGYVFFLEDNHLSGVSKMVTGYRLNLLLAYIT